MATIKQSIRMYPMGATWEAWNGDLLHYFGEEPLPMVDEKNWQVLANAVCSLASFDNYGIPDPVTFEDWQDWVNELILAVNGPTI